MVATGDIKSRYLCYQYIRPFRLLGWRVTFTFHPFDYGANIIKIYRYTRNVKVGVFVTKTICDIPVIYHIFPKKSISGFLLHGSGKEWVEGAVLAVTAPVPFPP